MPLFEKLLFDRVDLPIKMIALNAKVFSKHYRMLSYLYSYVLSCVIL